MKIDKITKSVAEMIARRAEVALRTIAEEYGMTVTSRGGKFTAGSLMNRFEFILSSVKAVDEEADFRLNASMYGINPEWFGKTFTVKGIKMTVVGLNHSKPKNRVKLLGDNGKQYKASVEWVKAHMKGVTS